jgi:hypothetical protein
MVVIFSVLWCLDDVQKSWGVAALLTCGVRWSYELYVLSTLLRGKQLSISAGWELGGPPAGMHTAEVKKSYLGWESNLNVLNSHPNNVAAILGYSRIDEV